MSNSNELKENMFRRVAAVCTLGLVGVLGLASCASLSGEPQPASQSTPDPSPDSAHTDDSDGSDSGDADVAKSTIPDGARAASPDFPFPVPEGWEEMEPFTEEKIGKSVAMSAIYAHPGDAETAANTYSQLLKAAGFDAYSYQLGAVTNDASLMVEGAVNGVAYKGPLDFDTDADGTSRVRINLTQE